MNKFLYWVVIFVMIFAPVGFAQMPVAVTGPAGAAGIEKIGVVAATHGKVEVTTPGAAGRIAQSGQEIFIGDQVTTDEKGHLQILLLDQTVFTIGANTAITIDKFVYDPKTQDGQMEASISKGIFRYVSGKIAAKKPSNVKINLPTATIGIRGTIVAGEAGGQGSFAMLLGPGGNNDAGAGAGSFSMSGTGDNSNQSQDVNRTGFGVETGEGGGLSAPFQVPEERVNQLSAGLAPQGGGEGGGGGEGSGEGGLTGGGNVGDMSGETGAGGLMNAGDMSAMGGFVNGLSSVTGQLSQDVSDATGIDGSGGTPTQTISTTTLEELSAHRMGEAPTLNHYASFFGVFNLVSNGHTYPGTLNASITVDFDNDKAWIGGALGESDPSYVEINVPTYSALHDYAYLDSKNLFTDSYDETSAIYTFSRASDAGQSSTFNVTVTLQNIDQTLNDVTVSSDVAAQAEICVSYNNNDVALGDGVLTNVPLAEGGTGTQPVVVEEGGSFELGAQ